MSKYTAAQARAVKKYLENNNLVNLNFRVSEAVREMTREQAEKNGKSITAYIIDLVNADIQKENKL